MMMTSLPTDLTRLIDEFNRDLTVSEIFSVISDYLDTFNPPGGQVTYMGNWTPLRQFMWFLDFWRPDNGAFPIVSVRFGSGLNPRELKSAVTAIKWLGWSRHGS